MVLILQEIVSGSIPVYQDNGIMPITVSDAGPGSGPPEQRGIYCLGLRERNR